MLYTKWDISSNDEFVINLFSKLCWLLNEQGWITTLFADSAEASYKLFVANADVKNQTKEFNMDERQYVFYMSHLSCHVELRELVKLLIILSHGNALLESGFSVNEELLVENMLEGSFVAWRMVFDGGMNEGRICNVDVQMYWCNWCNL